MFGTFIVVVLGTCLGLCQVCRLALFIKIAKKPSVLFSPHSMGDHNYGWRTQNLGSPAANDAGVIAFFFLLSVPFIFYDNALQALSGAELNNSSWGSVLIQFLLFSTTVTIGDKSSKQFQKISIKIMSRLLPNDRVNTHPLDREDLRPKYTQYESYENFSERRRRKAWESSFFAKDYASYDDYAAKNERNKTSGNAKTKTRNYAKAETQSIPQTPRIGAMHMLGLTGHPSAAQIKSAYLKLARIHHPDNFMTQSAQLIEAAEVKMKNINAAYEYLKNNP